MPSQRSQADTSSHGRTSASVDGFATTCSGLIMFQHLRPALIGLAIGVAGALGLGRLLRTMVYGVGTTDVFTVVSMSVALVAVTAVACWVPARRATRVDPLIALRAEQHNR